MQETQQTASPAEKEAARESLAELSARRGTQRIDAAMSQAAPGRKIIEPDAYAKDDEFVASMVGGWGPYATSKTPPKTWKTSADDVDHETDLTRLAPAIPIATFYGPQAKHDAELFGAAYYLYETSKTLDALMATVMDMIKVSTGGEVDLMLDDVTRRCIFANRISRMLALGVEVVTFCGEDPQGEFHHRKMTCHEALYWLSIDSNVMTKLSDLPVAYEQVAA